MTNTQPVPTGVAKTEPATLVGMITALVSAVIALAVAYGVDIDDSQSTAIMGLIAVLAPIIAAIVTRSRVYSPASTQKVANDAAQTGDATIPPPPANGAQPSKSAKRAEAVRQYRE